ncbi:MAG: LysM peptidoglycan-binding domain-containing protein [Synechococcaceae bacterium WB8_1B_136]|nr:LysM peptidoglycan-binding domain-containing protein [Synechococcaceae bacterium WB8_1B_136]
MKPSHFFISTLAGSSLLGLVGASLLPTIADSRASFELGSLPEQQAKEANAIASLPSLADRLWVKVRNPISIEQLASQLAQDETKLAKLNDVNEDHEFNRGDWLVLPSQSSRRAKQLAAIDTTELRRSPPLAAPPQPEDNASVRFGDNLVKIAQRYNLTIAELLRLNPGLEAARLVVGTQIRLAQSSPARPTMVLGLKPTGSGGLSWPDQDFGDSPSRVDPNQPFNTTGWIWPAAGVFSSGYGWRWGRMHKGIDVANNVGTPIHAAKAGQVVSAGWNDGGYGYLVEIRHDDGTMTRYAHNSRILVSSGDVVAQGTVISLMGSTGRSTGPHLHFEILPPGRGAVNPLQFLPARA